MNQNTNNSPRQTWIFQGNPNRYNLEVSLQTEQEESWNLNQHAKSVRAGDRVLIWISGDQAGIYAVGSVLDDPELRPDSTSGIGYWYDPAEGLKVKARVRVRYERRLFDHPLRKAYLQADPQLWDMTILHMPRATVFSVTEQEWQAIEAWLDENTDTGVA
jgi:predicted RNA-binding protein with PUA-like domain